MKIVNQKKKRKKKKRKAKKKSHHQECLGDVAIDKGLKSEKMN